MLGETHLNYACVKREVADVEVRDFRDQLSVLLHGRELGEVSNYSFGLAEWIVLFDLG